jgi:hypothetical protein
MESSLVSSHSIPQLTAVCPPGSELHSEELEAHLKSQTTFNHPLETGNPGGQ